MYIEKTCSVNLNYSMEICSNLTSGNYSEIQAEVHKHVSTLQSINGILQVCLSNFYITSIKEMIFNTLNVIYKEHGVIFEI